MKKQTKALIGVVAATSLTVAVASILFLGNPMADATNASFNGIGNIIKSAKDDTPFTVVELVPDEKMAKFGYFIEGSEPENWKEDIAKLDTKEKRIKYMTDLKTKLSTISASDKTKPLTYNEYKELYSLDGVSSADEDKYSSFELTTPLKIEKNKTSGYKMEPSPGGSFKLNASYTEENGGNYEENVAGYAFLSGINGRYAVKFKIADATALNKDKIYKANELHKISNKEEVRILAANRYIYRKKKEGSKTETSYQFAFSNKDVEDYIIDKDYDYALLSFEEVDKSKLSEEDKTNNTYYVVEEVKDLVDTKDAEYKGVLDETEPYKKVADGTGHYKMNPANSYVFVGKGHGDMKLVEAAGSKLDYDLELNKVFYTGGFKNNNWFENGVFLKNFSNGIYLDAADPNYNNDRMKFKVITLTPGGINAKIDKDPSFLSQVGLFYVSASSSLVKPTGLKTYKTGSNDISDTVLTKIKTEVTKRNFPVVIEYNNTTYNSTKHMKSLMTTLVLGRDSVDKDHDGHFVGKSVYVVNLDKADNTPFIFDSFATDFIGKKTSDSAFTNAADGKGFKEVAESIVEENNIIAKGVEGTTENTEKFELEISKARVIEYIISINMKRTKTTDSEIKVLNIEPAKVVDKDPKIRMKDILKTWFGKDINSNTETIPTTEFIGRNEDLSSYDVIYMGLNTSNFNMKNGQTAYNDTNMNGLIYSNIGDLTYARVNEANVKLTGNEDKQGFETPDEKKAYQASLGGGTGSPQPYLFESKAGLLDTDYHKINNSIFNNVEAYKDADDKADGIKINYNKELEDAAANSNLIKEYIKNIKVITTKTLSYRFAGNDITEEKLKKLKEYIQAGYPIVFAKDFVTGTGAGMKVNGDRIDNSSRMYELTQFALDFRKANPDKKNVIFETGGNNLIGEDRTGLIDNINLPKPSILVTRRAYENDMDGKPADYTRIDDRTLEIDFKLLNKGFESEKVKFKVSLFVDKNADGKYSATKEIVDTRLYDLLKDGVKQKGDVNASNTANYKIRYTLPNGYIGIIPWKVKVELVGGTTNRFASETGFGYIKNEEKKQKIKVLQIMTAGFDPERPDDPKRSKPYKPYKYNTHYSWNEIPDPSGGKRWVKPYGGYMGDKEGPSYYGTKKKVGDWRWNTGNNFNMQTDPTFNKLRKQVSDFDITIKAITAQEFAKEYKKFRDDHDDFKGKYKGMRPEDYFEKNEYNMVVLGFADCYAIPNEYNCLDAIQGFINAGKPVLFTHDCTSYGNYRGTSPWGYDFNRMIRGQVGLDRYGVLNNWAIRLGVESEKNNSGIAFEKSKYPTVNKNSDHNVTSKELFEIAEKNAKTHHKDIAYVPKSGKTKIVREVQGYTFGSAISWTDINIGDGVRKDKNGSVTHQYFLYKDQAYRTFETATADQVNRGQITTYPFKINPKAKVQRTHFQPYQLDLNEDADGDGESDLIVWYTLGLSEAEEKNAANRGNWYNLSPKDVRNNYYIYTKGNITYSGVGHKPIKDEEEMKLYINTLVAAYKAALLPPDVRFVESGKPDADEKNTSYISYDVSSDAKNKGSIEDKVRVYFVARDDNNLVRNIKEDETRILFYYKVGSVEKAFKTFKADGTELTATLKDKNDKNRKFLEKGEVYYFEVPATELIGDKNKLEIEVVVRTRFTKEYKGSSGVERFDFSPEGSSIYTIQKRGLFDLD